VLVSSGPGISFNEFISIRPEGKELHREETEASFLESIIF